MKFDVSTAYRAFSPLHQTAKFEHESRGTRQPAHADQQLNLDNGE
jgi:hypothetical protein